MSSQSPDHRYKKFRTAVVIAAILVAVSFTAAGVTTLYHEYRADIREAERLSVGNSDIVHHHVKLMIADLNNVLKTVSYRINMEGLADRNLQELLIQSAAETPLSALLIVVDPEGRVMIDSRYSFANQGLDVSDHDWFEVHRTPSPYLYIGSPCKSEILDTVVVPLSRAVRSEEGELLAVVAVGIDPFHFTGFFASVAGGENDRVVLVHADSTLLARFPFVEKAIGASMADMPIFKKGLPQGKQGVFQAVSPVDGEKRIIGYRTVPPWPLIVAFGKSENDALAPFYRGLITWGLVAAICLALDILTSMFLISQAGKLAQNANSLQQVTLDLQEANDNLSKEIEERQKTEKVLREKKEIIKLFYQAMPEPVILYDLASGRCVDVNNGFIQLFGWSREEAVGMTAKEPDLWCDPGARDEMFRRITESGYAKNLETCFKKKDGQPITALLSTVKVMINGKHHLISMIRDISDRIAAQAEKDRLERQLRQSRKMEAIGAPSGRNP